MANYKPYNPNQLFFQTIDPAAFREDDGVLRVVDDFVEEYLPVESFSEKVRNDMLGAAALDPRLVCKVLFYAIAKGVRSYRSIEERLAWDPAFKILSAGKIFDHSTLCRFISLHRNELEEFFAIMVYVLIKQGYMTTEFFATDGTKIKAWAGKDFTGSYHDFVQRSAKLQKKIEQILASMGNENPDPTPSGKLSDLQRKKRKIDKFVEQVKNDAKRTKSDEKVNLTDPDAGRMKDKSSYYLGYNLMLSVDSNHFIGAYQVFNCTADQPHVIPMISRLRETVNDPLTNSILAFDAGFYSPGNILFLHRENLNAFVPEGQAEDGSKISRKEKNIGSKDCTLANADNQAILTCPGGQAMTGRLTIRKSPARVSYLFIPQHARCCFCPLKQRCLGKQPRKYFEVDKIMFDSLDERCEMKQRVASAVGREIRNKRFSTNEHVNGEIKEQMNLRQFYHRGRDKVRTISCLTAIAYNFRRLAAVS